MTTSHQRSFASLVMAHLAVTLVVCGGLVLLLPAPASSQGLPATISVFAVTHCDASANSAAGHQLAGDDGELSAPDSDDDDDDDDAPTGSDAAIVVDQCRTITSGNVMAAVHIGAEPWMSRAVDGHSLRGPPADDGTSDADLDGDNDDDPCAEYSAPLPPQSSQELWVLTPVEFVRASSTRSSDLSPRAPPL